MQVFTSQRSQQVVGLPGYVLDKDQKRQVMDQVQWAKDDNGDWHMRINCWIPVNPGNRGQTGRSIGLASINDWDSEKRQPKDTIVGDLPPELTRGTAAFAVMSLNVAGVSKKGHTFPDFTEAEVEAQSNDSAEA